jgi:hypothetical protein
MRTPSSFIFLSLFAFSGCIDADLAASVRDRLGVTTELLLVPSASSGNVLASHYTTSGWQGGSGTVSIASGELDLDTDAAGDLEVGALTIDIQPITLPASVFDTTATLQDVSLALASPTLLPALWSDDNAASASASLPMTLQWSIDVDGIGIQLGSPQLPPLPRTITLSGSGNIVNATISIAASGTLWSWADLLQLDGLDLSLAASSEF